MNESSALHSLVLIGRYPGKDMAVAQALARCMAREEAWGLRIVSSAPIVIFDKLSQRQASQVMTALIEVANAGCRFEIQPGSVSSLPKVGWSTPPKIDGRPLSDIAPGADPQMRATLPAASLSPVAAPVRAPATGLSAPAGQKSPAPDASTQATATLSIPCPYTGQPMKLTITIALSRDNAGSAFNITASAAAPVMRPTDKALGAVTSGTVIPPNARQTGGQIQLRNSGPNSRPVALPVMEPARHEARARAITGPFSVGNAGQAPVEERRPGEWRRNTPDEIALPDVPVLPSSNISPARAEMPVAQPLPLDSAPMDISTFEANLGLASRDSVQPFMDSDSGVFSDLLVPDADEIRGEEELNEHLLCSVFIERSSSPVVHELVAELHGIPESEASELCVSGSVALAENIPLFEAKDIKRRCAEINVFARIVRQD